MMFITEAVFLLLLFNYLFLLLAIDLLLLVLLSNMLYVAGVAGHIINS